MLKKVSLVILVAIMVFLVGCTASTPETTVPPSSSPSSTITPAASVTPAPEASVTPTPEVVKLKIGSLPRIFDMIAYAGVQEGVFAKHNLDVEVVPFRSQVEKDNAMVTGAIDGNIESAYGAITLNINQETCKLVGFFSMPGNIALVVSPKSGITEISQLKGQKIATSTGTIMEYGLDRILATAGINSQDVTYVNITNMSLRVETLEQGDIAAAILTPPLSDYAISRGNILLADDTQLKLSGAGILFSSEALKNKSKAIADFVSAWQETVQMINANPEKFRSLLVTTAKVPESVANIIKIPVFPELRLPAQEEVTAIVEWMKTKGLITGDFSYDRAISSQYLK